MGSGGGRDDVSYTLQEGRVFTTDEFTNVEVSTVVHFFHRLIWEVLSSEPHFPPHGLSSETLQRPFTRDGTVPEVLGSTGRGTDRERGRVVQ